MLVNKLTTFINLLSTHQYNVIQDILDNKNDNKETRYECGSFVLPFVLQKSTGAWRATTATSCVFPRPEVAARGVAATPATSRGRGPGSAEPTVGRAPHFVDGTRFS